MRIQDARFQVSMYTEKRAIWTQRNVDLIQFILNPKREYKKEIDEIRACEYHGEEYIEKKMYLPVILSNGIVPFGAKREIENVIINPTIIIDVDLVDNPKLLDLNNLMDWKFELINQKDAILVSTSVGGRGLMVLHRLSDKVTKEDYVKYFNKLERRYKEEFGLIIDDSCKNINRFRYITYDDDFLFNEIFESLELDEEDYIDEKTSYSQNNTIKINLISNIYDLDKSVGPFYFGHSSRHMQVVNGEEIEVPFIFETIHTMLCFMSKEEAKEIWKHEKMYTNDYSSVIRWIDNYKVVDKDGNVVPKEQWKPSLRVVKFLNKYCGFNIEYSIEEEKNDIDILKNDILADIFGKKTEIDIGDGYIDDKREEIVNLITSKTINMIVCPPGKGKTTMCDNIQKDTDCSMCVIQPYKSIISSKYDTTRCELCIEKKKIIPEYKYVVTHYNNFIEAYEKYNLRVYDYIILDESHLIGMQPFRDDVMIKTVNLILKYHEEYPDTKIVIMTGTPSNEQFLFDDKIKNIIEIKAIYDKTVIVNYMDIQMYHKTEDEVSLYKNNFIKNIVHLSKIAKEEGRKIYIYWGTGSMVKAEIIQEAEKALNDMEFAVYHKRNEGNEDLIYIRDNSKLGKYDGMMSSCYFSVGCDLNDDSLAQVIIVGNNPYQEDMQVVERFRKSNNIKVTILVDSLKIKKYDCEKELDREIENMTRIMRAKDSRQTSLITKETNDEELIKKAYIKTSRKYFSDIRRKFAYFTEKGWIIYNTYNEFYDDKNEWYSINEIAKAGTLVIDKDGNTKQLDSDIEIPFTYYIDDLSDIIDKITKTTKAKIRKVKEEILHNLRVDHRYELDEIYEKSYKYKSLQDWIEVMQTFQKYYDIEKLLKLNNKTLYSLNRYKLKALFRWTINYDKTDQIENWVINKLISIKDNINQKDYENTIALYYIIWCSAFDDTKDYEMTTYDLNKRYSYPVYKKWKDNVESILDVNDDVREIIMEVTKEKENTVIDEFTKQFFELENEPDIEHKISWIKNKYISKSNIIDFISFIIHKRTTNEKKKAAMIGRQNHAKRITVTDKFKHTEKYGLEVGLEFDSLLALSEYINRPVRTVKSWKKKGWVKKVE